MADPKADSGPSFFLSLGSQLGELRANQDALLGRIESLENQLGNGAPQQQQQEQQQLAPQQAMVAQPPKSPLDTFTHFTGETAKLMQGIAELKKLATDFGPLLQSLKAQQPAAPATQTAQPAAPAPPAAVTVTGTVVQQQGHA